MIKKENKELNTEGLLHNLYYYPEVNVIQRKGGQSHKFDDEVNNPQNKKTYLFTLNFSAPEDKIAHLPKHVSSEIPSKMHYEINDNGYIRNDRVILFLNEMLNKQTPFGAFILDTTYFSEYQKKGHFFLLGFGKYNEICSFYDPDSPIDKRNLSLLDDCFMKATMPLKPKTSNLKLNKF